MVLVADMLTIKKVWFSLGGHETRVNSVAWLDHNTLVSVSDKIVVYRGEGVDGADWRIVQVISENGQQINYLTVMKTPESNYVCTMADDGVLRLYKGSD